jgi:hypothetical protein
MKVAFSPKNKQLAHQKALIGKDGRVYPISKKFVKFTN